MNSGISLGVHIVLVVFMIKYTDLRAYGLLIGDIIFPLLILILNAVFIKKKISPQIHWENAILKPLVGTFIMGIAIIIFKVLVRKYEYKKSVFTGSRSCNWNCGVWGIYH